MPISTLSRARHTLAQRSQHWSPTTRGLLWTSAAGLLFSMLNALMRLLTQQIDPFQTQFLRYFFGLLVLLPVMLRGGGLMGLGAYKPKSLRDQFSRGLAHSVGLALWFTALPKIPLADMTAIGFTGPIFIMIGAYLAFKESMRWERWVAVALGFGGVLIVVGPKLSASGGWYHLIMLASAPVFAVSFLLTKAMTRYETPGVILVWQSITVSLLTLPLAVWFWQPLQPWQWLAFVVTGVLGSAGHYCLTRSFAVADISATQSAKFLDLVWSAVMGFLLFSDIPSQSTIIGGMVIASATLWLATRESKQAAARKRSAAEVEAEAEAGGTT
jgi:drug/metabolite transporter (DMT)-like permease